MRQATNRDHALIKAGYGKLHALKTRIHGHPDMHGVPYDCSKAHGCLRSNVGTGTMPNTRAC